MRAALIIAIVALFSDVSAAPTTKLSVTKTKGFKPAPVVTTFTPELEASALLSTQALDGPVRTEHVRILVDLIATTPDREAEEKADYRYRLAEIYARETRFYRKRGDLAKATEALDKARPIYEALFASAGFRDFPKADQAVFLYAYTLHEAGLPEAKRAFDRVLKEYPNSKYAPEAQMVLADALFAANKLADADIGYQMLHKHPRPYTSYGRYKRGYILLAQQKPAAYQAFVDLLGEIQDDQKLEPLARATRTAVLHALIQQNKDVVKLAPIVDNTVNLAVLYAQRGRLDRAAAVYRGLIKQQPTHADLCSWQLGLAKTMVAPTVEVCTPDVEAFKAWATATGVDVR